MIIETAKALIQLFKTVEPNTHLSMGNVVELATLPAVILDGPVLQEVTRRQRDAEKITAIDPGNMAAVREKPPRWYNLQFNVAFSDETKFGLLALLERFSRLAQGSRLLLAVGEERTREYSWMWRVPPSANTEPNVSEIAEGRGELIVHDVEVYGDIRETIPLIRVIELGLNGEELRIDERS